MDVNRLSTGEKIAGISGVLLLIIMFAFDWFSIDVSGGVVEVSGGGNAWEAFGFIDIVLFLAVVSGIALAVTAAMQSRPDMPVALSAITAGLGILGVVLVLFRIISPPDFGADVEGIDVGRSIGVFLGLIAVAGVAYGGWTAMQEEGTSFSDQADRLQDRGPGPGGGPGEGTGGAPPPPPPSGGTGTPPPPPPPGGTSAPPPSGTPGGPAA